MLHSIRRERPHNPISVSFGHLATSWVPPTLSCSISKSVFCNRQIRVFSATTLSVLRLTGSDSMMGDAVQAAGKVVLRVPQQRGTGVEEQKRLRWYECDLKILRKSQAEAHLSRGQQMDLVGHRWLQAHSAISVFTKKRCGQLHITYALCAIHLLARVLETTSNSP